MHAGQPNCMPPDATRPCQAAKMHAGQPNCMPHGPARQPDCMLWMHLNATRACRAARRHAEQPNCMDAARACQAAKMHTGQPHYMSLGPAQAWQPGSIRAKCKLGSQIACWATHAAHHRLPSNQSACLAARLHARQCVLDSHMAGHAAMQHDLSLIHI